MKEKYNRVPLFSQQVAKYFGLFMVVFYLVLGILFIILPGFFPELSREPKLIFGVILVMYGVFRAYRVFKSLKHDNSE
jgi:hypothetical protein